MVAMEEQQVTEEAWHHLRSHTRGELRYDERLDRFSFVFARNGRIVFPASPFVLEATDTVLFLPENRSGTMEVQVSIEELEPDGPQGAVTDRWRIYHGDAREARWAIAAIDAVRDQGRVVDGSSLERDNPLAADESSLCRFVNREHREGLRDLCVRYAGAEAEAPLLVGVDPYGFDVRRRFDVIRVPVEPPMRSAAEVRERFTRMLEEAT